MNDDIQLTVLEQELQKALTFITANWSMQNNFNDYRSNFIYSVDTVDECIGRAKENGVSEDYALHRWYNYKTSKRCEEIFVEYGADKESDYKNKEIDIYIDGTPFDVKLTVYPKALSNHPYNLTTRDGKNEMIKWMYLHQSQQQRKHLANRLFIVCDGPNQFESLKLKSDFIQIKSKILAYMKFVGKNGFNQLEISDSGEKYSVCSDIIVINQWKLFRRRC